MADTEDEKERNDNLEIKCRGGARLSILHRDENRDGAERLLLARVENNRPVITSLWKAAERRLAAASLCRLGLASVTAAPKAALEIV